MTLLLRQYLAYHSFLTSFNFHSLRISIIYVSILAFCQVLLNEYDDDDDDDDFEFTFGVNFGHVAYFR